VNSRALFLFMALMVGLFVLTGCGTDNAERQRLVAEADLVNGGQPLIVAALNVGDPGNNTDDFVPIEMVSVVFSARPLNDTMVIPENGTYSTFNVTHYSLEWVLDASTPPGLSAYDVERANITVSIPVNDDVVASVLVASLAMKSEPWFIDMADRITDPFTAGLNITFYGHGSSSEYEVALPAGTHVLFVPEISDQ